MHIHLLLVGIAGLVTQPGAEPDGRTQSPPTQCGPAVVPQRRATGASAPVPRARSLDTFDADAQRFDLGPLTAAEATPGAPPQPGMRRTGVVRRLEEALNADDCVRHATEDGDTLWTLSLHAAGAHGLRLHLTHVDLGSGELLVYSEVAGKTSVRGPYQGTGLSGDGEFWTPSLPGDVIHLEIRAGDEAPRFVIEEILHFEVPLGGRGAERRALGQWEDPALDCHLDAACMNDISDAARDATGRMTYIDNGESWNCTGTLINDLDPSTFVPFFLTARHCIGSQAVADTMEVTWFYDSVGCNVPIAPDVDDLPFNYGGWIVATDSENDMTLLRLVHDVPPGLALVGWNTDTSSGVYGIHHPAGSFKRGVYLDAVGFCPGCQGCADGADYDFYDHDIGFGLTEGGSSGSGVFNAAGQLTGQLRGSCCLGIGCDPEDISCADYDDYMAFYGEFETTYPTVLPILTVGGTIHVSVANTSPPWNGTPQHPYFSVAQAHNAAFNGVALRVQAGSYDEAVTLTKAITVEASGGLVVIGQ